MTVCTLSEGTVRTAAAKLLSRVAGPRMSVLPRAGSVSADSVLDEVASVGTSYTQELIEEPEVFGGALTL